MQPPPQKKHQNKKKENNPKKDIRLFFLSKYACNFE